MYISCGINLFMLNLISGIEGAMVGLLAQKAEILFNSNIVTDNEIQQYIEDMGFHARYLEGEHTKEKCVEFKASSFFI